MAGTTTRGFLYSDVAAELQRRITTGEYPRGTRIPSEASLVRAFGVSAITIRRAIMELMHDGFLYGRQGLGIFVADRRRIVRVLSGNVRISMGDEIRRAGLEPSIRTLSSTRVPATYDLAGRLNLRHGSIVFRHEKLVLADNEPITIDTVFLPRQVADSLKDGLDHEFVFPLLRKAGIRIGRVDFRFEGMSASPEQASLLGLTARFALIVARYALFDQQGKPVLEGHSVARSDRMVFDLSTWPKRNASAGSEIPTFRDLRVPHVGNGRAD